MIEETVNVDAVVTNTPDVIAEAVVETPSTLVAVPKKNCKLCCGKGTLVIAKPGSFSVNKIDGKKKTAYTSPREMIPCNCLIDATARSIHRNPELNKVRAKMMFKKTDDGTMTVVV